MEVSITNINEHEVELSVSVPWNRVRDDYGDLLKKYVRMPVKGFRQGSAPRATVEKIFRKAILADLTYLCGQRLYRQALNENGLRAGSPVTISDAEIIPGNGFVFKANFLRMPEFELPDYSNLDLQSDKEGDKMTEISEKLLALTPFDIHDDFIGRELRFSDPGEKADEKVLRKEAGSRVKLLLILRRIAETDNIEVDQHDINARISEIATENEVTDRELRDYLMETGGLARLRDLLLAEQVLSYIAEINS